MTCCHCHGASGAEPDHRLIVGWERRSKSVTRRGGSDVFLRQQHPSGQWACGPCVSKLRDGLSVGQETLAL